MKPDEQVHYDNIKKKLKGEFLGLTDNDSWYPGFIYAEDDQKNWEQFLEKLLDKPTRKREKFRIIT